MTAIQPLTAAEAHAEDKAASRALLTKCDDMDWPQLPAYLAGLEDGRAEATAAERARITAAVGGLRTPRNSRRHWAPSDYDGCVGRYAVLAILQEPLP